MSDQDKIYDVAVIGGGIAGTAVARDAALRGLSAVLFEKNALGSGTSSRSSKLIHGGLRYLEIAAKALGRGRPGEAWKNFRFVFASLREARILERLAPDLVRPLAIVVPLYRGRGRKPLVVWAGAVLYWLLGFLGGGARFPTLLFTPEAVRKRLPGLLAEGLLGGVVVWDRTVDDRELVRRIARGAEARGARILEHAAASYGPRTPDGRIPVRVLAGGSEQTFFARSLVDASGPWVDRVRASAGERDADWLVPVAGSHIELKKFLPASMLLEAEDGRFFFVVNAGERSRVGTTERPSDDPDAVAPTEEEIAYLLRSLRHYFPGVPAARSDVLAADAGIRPLARPSRETRANEISREHELRTSPSGALHLIGVKLTDHRRAAAEAVDRIVRDLGRPGVPRRTLTDKVPF